MTLNSRQTKKLIFALEKATEGLRDLCDWQGKKDGLDPATPQQQALKMIMRKISQPPRGKLIRSTPPQG